MKILHLNNQDTGGAAIASLGLHYELLKQKIDSNYISMDNNLNLDDIEYIFRHKPTIFNINYIYKRHLLPQIHKRIYNSKINSNEIFSTNSSTIDITKHRLYLDADIIHIHNGAEFIDFKSFAKKCKKNIVITLHDLFILNGLLHIFNPIELDAVTAVLTKKFSKVMNELLNLNTTIIAPSKPVQDLAITINPLIKDKIEIINNGINPNTYIPMNKYKLREKWKIEQSKKVILMIANDLSRKNKNFKIINQILAKGNISDILVILIGKNAESIKCKNLNYKTYDYIHPNKMNEIYNIADVTVIPSFFETFSLTTAESISCGTPVVAFDNSGPADIISHLENGYLAKYKDYNDFIKGIYYNIANLNQQNIKPLPTSFHIDDVAKRYISIYQAISN